MVVRLAMSLLLLLVPLASTWAKHSDQTPITDGTAHTLNAGEVRVGLFNVETGLFDRLELGTIHLLWLAKVSNLYSKVRIFQSEDISVSLSGGISWVNAREYSDENPDVTIYAVNGGVFFTKLVEPYTLSLGLVVTELGHTDLSAQDVDLNGAGKGTSGLIRPQVQYRLSERTAFVLDGNIQLFQRYEVAASSGMQLNERVRYDVYGNTEVDLSEGLTANITSSVVWSWDTFNLRLGYRYGDFSVPVYDILIPITDENGARKRSGYPIMDLYWRF